MTMRRFIVLLTFVVLFPLAGSQAEDLTLADRNILLHQIDMTRVTAEKLSALFQVFSDGYIEAEEALTKLSLYGNDYTLAVSPVLPEGEHLHELMKRLISHAENYFIHFKSVDRESAFINYQIAKTKIEIAKELAKFEYLL